MGGDSLAKSAVLVTGGCGYIGSHVTRLLSEAGRRVVVVDNLSTNGTPAALLHGEPFYQVDCGDQAAVLPILKDENVESIIHFAAFMLPQESVTEPERYYRNNVVKFLSLLEAAATSGVKNIIFSSTCAVYGTSAEPVCETSPQNPESPYGWSKLMGERILRDVCDARGLSHVILRYFNVAGASPDARIGQRSKVSTHIFKIAAEAAAGKRDGVTVFGEDYPTPDGTCIRDYVHVVDLAAAHIKALEYLERGGKSDTLNCGYGQGVSVKQAIEAMQRATGRSFPVRSGPRRPGDPAEINADGARIQKILGWEPRFSDLETIAKHAFQWEVKL